MSESLSVSSAPEAALSPDAVRDLAERSVERDSAPAFQSMLAAVIASVTPVAAPLREAEAAALNLAQRQHVAAVAADLDAVVAALDAGVSDEARCLAPGRRTAAEVVRAVLRPAPGWLPRLRERAAELALATPPPSRPWIASTTAAVEALGQTAEHVATLGQNQPAASSARRLGDAVAARLRVHRGTLLADVARLVD